MGANRVSVKSATVRELSSLADIYQTPFYTINIGEIVANYHATVKAWTAHFSQFRCAYSFKTNSLPVITASLKREGASAEVVSGRELDQARAQGFPGRDIFFNGPYKTDAELRMALRLGANVQVDSVEELRRLCQLPSFRRSEARISFRLTTWRAKRWSRFGLHGAEVQLALELLRESGHQLAGIHLHSGSNIVNPSAYMASFKLLMPTIKKLKAFAGTQFRINFGGGFATQSADPSALVPRPKDYAGLVSAALESAGFGGNEVEIVIEPGRVLVEMAGWLVTRVTSVKRRNGDIIATLEAPGTLVGSASRWHHPIHCVATGKKMSRVEIFGSNCFEGDWVGHWSGQGRIAEGSLVFVGAAGGYDMATANAWIRELPPIIVLGGLGRGRATESKARYPVRSQRGALEKTRHQ